MNAQHLMNNTCTTLDSMNVANSPHAPIPLAHMTVYAILVSKVMATIVAISTSVNLRSITVHSMLDVTILWDHIHVNVILGFLVMAKLVITSMNAPKTVYVNQIPYSLINLVVTYVTVKAGFIKSDSGFCEDINECLFDACVANATCKNTPGSYDCSSDSGYRGDGVECDDINECDDSSSCPGKNTRCENNDGSFNRPCLNGYSDIDGICVDDNECVVGHSCNENTRCSNTDGSYQCFCESGFVKKRKFHD